MKYIKVESCEDCPYNDVCYKYFVQQKHKNSVDTRFPLDDGKCPLPDFPKTIKQYLEVSNNGSI